MLVCGAALLAGWVDAVGGGGGLIQIPALFAIYPVASPAMLLGTNKLSSCFGTAVALARYRSLRFVEPRRWLVAVGAALAGSAVGAFGATQVPAHLMRALVLGVVLAVLAYMIINKALLTRSDRSEKLPNAATQGALGAGAGFYDGLLGPGTGSFLILGLVRWCRMDLVRASAAAKVMNLATNVGALTFFVMAGSVDYRLGFPMATCNIVGAWVGASMAGRFGPRLVRLVLFLVVAVLSCKLLIELFD